VKGPHLTGPQWNKRAEGEAGLNFGAAHFCPGGTEGDGEGTSGACLDLDLGHLEWAERNIGEKLGACGASEPYGALVLLGRFLASEVHVGILEYLVEAILEHALERVSEEGGADTFPDALCAFLSNDGLQGAHSPDVLGRVYLRTRR